MINSIEVGKEILKKHYDRQLKVAQEKYTGEDVFWVNKKYNHSLEVFEMSQYLIENEATLNDLDDDLKLYGQLGALLHDIGRAYEIGHLRKSVIPHGIVGADVLVNEEHEDNIFLIYSMKYHDDLNAVEKTLNELNELKVNDNDKENIILLLKLVMDSDRLSNYTHFKDINKRFIISKERLPFFTESCLNSFKNRKLVNNTERKTVFDQMLGYICWSYDLFYNASKKFIKESNCLRDLLNIMKIEIKNFDNKDENKLLSVFNDIEKQLVEDNLLH